MDRISIRELYASVINRQLYPNISIDHHLITIINDKYTPAAAWIVQMEKGQNVYLKKFDSWYNPESFPEGDNIVAVWYVLVEKCLFYNTDPDLDNYFMALHRYLHAVNQNVKDNDRRSSEFGNYS